MNKSGLVYVPKIKDLSFWLKITRYTLGVELMFPTTKSHQLLKAGLCTRHREGLEPGWQGQGGGRGVEYRWVFDCW